MSFCQKCGVENVASASFCGSCGSSVALAMQPPRQNERRSQEPTATMNDLNGAISDSWKETFALFEKAGGIKLPNFKNLPSKERSRLIFNVWGLLFGPIYYLAKGMWKKAITLMAIGMVAIIMLYIILESMGISAEIITNFVIPIIFATRANTDYYKKMILGDNGWW